MEKSNFVIIVLSKPESSNGGEKIANKLNTSLLGKLPLDHQILKAGDSGEPIVLNDNYKEYIDRIDEIYKIRTKEKGSRTLR